MPAVDLPIIDVDAHWTEARDLWTSRAPADLKKRAPRIELVNGRENWVVDEDVLLGPVGLSVIRRDGTKQYEAMTLKTYDEFSASSYVPSERLKVMDSHGIVAQIEYPNTLGTCGGKIMNIADGRLREFCLQAYNDASAEVQEESGRRLFPQAVLPIWDIDGALKELDRCRAMGLTGCVLTDKPEDWGLPALNEPYWFPLWEALEALRLPVNFHVGGGADRDDYGAWLNMNYQQQLAAISVITFMNNAKIMINCMFSGLLDRFPDLKFVSVESGVGWVPFVLEAAEYQFDQWFVDRKPVQRRPREYFSHNFYCSWWFEETDILRDIQLLGEDRVMFETDFPHPTCLYPDVRGPLDRALAGASDDLKKKLVYENARHVYSLPLEPLG
ncbi:MAG: uncharacterized protein QOC92_3284 [Acidimicrobiaceae bacterium]